VNEILYLYGFVPADAPAPPASLAGVAGTAVHLLPAGRVQAVVSRLPAADYDAATVEARMQDLAWVGEHGLDHERVVLWFVDHARIIPARLLSLYSGDDTLQAAAAGLAPRIAAQLEALGDRREWNLKVACDTAELARHAADVSATVRDLDVALSHAPPGRRYLLQRRRTEIMRDEVSAAGRRLADELLGRLRVHADDVRTLPLAGADAAAGTVVLNAALLVHRDREEQLRADAAGEVEELRRLGVVASFSGPWAAYRFLREQTHD
jgi:hypothetical protein